MRTPHLLALDPDGADATLVGLANRACWYQIRRGPGRHAADFAGRLRQNRLGQDGPDNPRTLTAANTLAVILAETGRYAEARDLGEDTLARRRRLLGEDHPDTLTSARNLAIAITTR